MISWRHFNNIRYADGRIRKEAERTFRQGSVVGRNDELLTTRKQSAVL